MLYFTPFRVASCQQIWQLCIWKMITSPCLCLLHPVVWASLWRHMSIDSLSVQRSSSMQYVVFQHAVKRGDSSPNTHWPVALFYYLLHMPEVVFFFTITYFNTCQKIKNDWCKLAVSDLLCLSDRHAKVEPHRSSVKFSAIMQFDPCLLIWPSHWSGASSTICLPLITSKAHHEPWRRLNTHNSVYWMADKAFLMMVLCFEVGTLSMSWRVTAGRGEGGGVFYVWGYFLITALIYSFSLAVCLEFLPLYSYCSLTKTQST